MTRRWLLVAFVVAASLALLLAAVSVVLAGPSPSQLLTFRDHHDSEFVLTIEVSPQSSQAGMFTMRVPGRGVYASRAGAELKVNSPTSTIVRYAGDADLFASTSASVTFAPVSVTFQAQIDPAHHTAQATLTVAGEEFHLVRPAVGKGATTAVVTAFETALSSNDWRGLYSIATSDITNTMSADAFVAQADSQRAAIGATSRLDRLALGDIQTNPAGISFFVATYAVTQVRADGTRTTSTYDAYFVMQGEAWKLWFTARR